MPSDLELSRLWNFEVDPTARVRDAHGRRVLAVLGGRRRTEQLPRRPAAAKHVHIDVFAFQIFVGESVCEFSDDPLRIALPHELITPAMVRTSERDEPRRDMVPVGPGAELRGGRRARRQRETWTRVVHEGLLLACRERSAAANDADERDHEGAAKCHCAHHFARATAFHKGLCGYRARCPFTPRRVGSREMPNWARTRAVICEFSWQVERASSALISCARWLRVVTP